MDLPKDELLEVMNKVEKVLTKTDVQSMPPLVYHLMMLAQEKVPNLALQMVIDYFNKLKNNIQSTSKNDSNSEDFDSISTIADVSISKYSHLSSISEFILE